MIGRIERGDARVQRMQQRFVEALFTVAQAGRQRRGRLEAWHEAFERMHEGRIVKAVLNGQVIHENQELKTPTGANWVRKETATGPFMLPSM